MPCRKSVIGYSGLTLRCPMQSAGCLAGSDYGGRASLHPRCRSGRFRIPGITDRHLHHIIMVLVRHSPPCRATTSCAQSGGYLRAACRPAATVRDSSRSAARQDGAAMVSISASGAWRRCSFTRHATGRGSLRVTSVLRGASVVSAAAVPLLRSPLRAG